jgi:hypothetical protein
LLEKQARFQATGDINEEMVCFFLFHDFLWIQLNFDQSFLNDALKEAVF